LELFHDVSGGSLAIRTRRYVRSNKCKIKLSSYDLSHWLVT
jgi:hypothetical protein